VLAEEGEKMETDNEPTSFCQNCGDDTDTDGKHLHVKTCVSLCSRCGGLRPEDERYGKGDECDCIEEGR
jgi:hypothetical protein